MHLNNLNAPFLNVLSMVQSSKC